MWTPRRVMLMVLGLLVFGISFFTYNYFLGWIDGLPTLPERYLPQPFVWDPTIPPPDSKTERMIRQAFGDGCPELNYPIKTRVENQSMVFATDRVDIEPDGRLKLTPFSLAAFGKPNADTQFPEINTVHCDVAYIAFDRRLESLSDITRGKMIAAEFIADANSLYTDDRKGWIHIVHNHATPQTDDDATMKTRGPIYFRDISVSKPGQPQLWTRAKVELTDYQSRPPHIVDAQGMNIYLAEGALQFLDRKAPRTTSENKEQHQAVKAIELLQPDMKLTLDGDQSLDGRGTGKLPPEEKPRLLIKTLGMFRFDVPTNRARFEIERQTDNVIPQYVEVMRSSKKTGNDIVHCDRLDLQFVHRPPAGPRLPQANPPAQSTSSGPLEVDEARATGKLVVLTSDSEQLHAWGTELIYSKSRRESVLIGEPMVAVKEGHKIQARKLVLNQIDRSPTVVNLEPAREASSQGPGTIWLFDREDQRTIEVTWNDKLLIEKERDLDRITLTGGATFQDRERDQFLSGNQIKLWMAQDPNAPAAKPGDDFVDNRRSRPQKLHVIGQVVAKSPEMEILSPRDRPTDLLIVWFSDVPALPAGPLASANKPAPRATSGSPPALTPPPKTGSIVSPPMALQPPRPAPIPPPNTPRRPLQVNARIVEAFIVRDGVKNELDKVKCLNYVVVHQDPEDPKDRPLDIHSESLELIRTPDGDILKLTGPQSRVDTQQLTIIGPQIIFDQKENRANVDGAGSMHMRTSTTIKGEQRPQSSEIVVFWNEKMNLVGAFVSFVGSVQAAQDNTRVLCPRMDIYLDRTVSLKRMSRDSSGLLPAAPPRSVKQSDDEQPKVAKVICHRDGLLNAPRVLVTEETFQDGKLLRYQRVEAPEITFDNDEGKLKAGGPGEVRILQMGEKNGDPFAKKDEKNKAPVDKEMQLTRVLFRDRMEANNKIQTAYFYREVQVVNMPSNNPNAVIDENKLPDGGFSLHCDSLQVYQTKDLAGQAAQAMIAEGHAEVMASGKVFWGQADTIKYDEAADQRVILESHSSVPATISRCLIRGGQADTFSGETIHYWRKTNRVNVPKASFLNGTTGP